MRVDEVEDVLRIAKRIQRKADVLRLDFKAKGLPAKYDMDELLSLADIVVKKMTEELTKRNRDQ